MNTETIIDDVLDQLDEAKAVGEIEVKQLQVTISDLPSVLVAAKENLQQMKVQLNEAASVLIPITAVVNDEELKDVRKMISGVNKHVKVIADARLNTTNPVVQFQKDMIALEKEICSSATTQIDRTKKICDDYEVAEANKRKQEQLEQQKQIAKKAELEKVFIDLKTNADVSLSRHIHNAETEIRNRFDGLTLESFDSSIAALNGYKPLLKEDVYCGFFKAKYNINLLNYEEYTAKIAEAKTAFPIAQFTDKYTNAITTLVNELKTKAPAKKEELQKLAELEKENAELAEQQRKDAADLAKKQQLEREEALQTQEDQKKEDANNLVEQKALEVQLDTQAGMQSTGAISVKKHLLKATVSFPTAYIKLVEFYLKNGGDNAKLEFLADFAAKNGQPQIQGVTYNV